MGLGWLMLNLLGHIWLLILFLLVNLLLMLLSRHMLNSRLNRRPIIMLVIKAIVLQLSLLFESQFVKWLMRLMLLLLYLLWGHNASGLDSHWLGGFSECRESFDLAEITVNIDDWRCDGPQRLLNHSILMTIELLHWHLLLFRLHHICTGLSVHEILNRLLLLLWLKFELFGLGKE